MGPLLTWKIQIGMNLSQEWNGGLVGHGTYQGFCMLNVRVKYHQQTLVHLSTQLLFVQSFVEKASESYCIVLFSEACDSDRMKTSLTLWVIHDLPRPPEYGKQKLHCGGGHKMLFILARLRGYSKSNINTASPVSTQEQCKWTLRWWHLSSQLQHLKQKPDL